MLLLKNSLPSTSTQNLPSNSLKAHKILQSNHGSIPASQSSDPQLTTLHRSQLQKLKLMEINRDFN